MIEGAAVAEGYVSGDAARFASTDGVRSYRTGDRARIGLDGAIEFLGRLDSEVKIRGYRVSPAETAVALQALPEIRDAAVGVTEGDVGGERELVAFVETRLGDITIAEIRRRLAGSLLPAQIPSKFFFVSKVIINLNGKVDVPAMMQEAARRDQPATERTPPGTATERALAEIWIRVLKVESAMAEDDFFALGGHSLRALEVSSAYRKAYGTTIPVRDIFEFPVLADLARHLDEGRPGTDGGLIPLARGSGAGRILCLPPAFGSASVYKELVDALHLDHNVDGVDCPDGPGQAPSASFEDLVARIVASLPAGGAEYSALIGWSFGASLAVEAARQLSLKGLKPRLLLLDGRPLLPGETPERPRQPDTIEALSKRRYWSKVISIMRRTMTPGELADLERRGQNRLALWDRYEAGHFIENDILAIQSSQSDRAGGGARLDDIAAYARGAFDIVHCTGGHYNMFHPPHLTRWISRARSFLLS